MSTRTIARSSSNRKSASDLASSVLPTPVGPRKRNEPVGRLGSEMPARERRTASDTALTAVALADQAPADHVLHLEQLGGLALRAAARSGCRSRPRRPRRSARRRPPRRPAARARTSPRPRPPRSSLLQLGDAPVVDLAARLEVALAQQLVGLDPELVELLADRPRPRGGLLPLPARLEPAQLLLVSRRGRRAAGEPVDRRGVGLLVERELLHLQPVDRTAELVDLLR